MSQPCCQTNDCF